VPFALRAYELWREIEGATGESLLEITGGLWISSARRGSEVHVANFFENTLGAARRFGIAHELLERERPFDGDFPNSRCVTTSAVISRGRRAPWPEACVRAQLALAARSGATLQVDERVMRIEQSGDEVRVVTDRGEYAAARAVLAAGAGAVELLPPEVARLLSVSRQVQYWFETEGHDELPVWIWELQGLEHGIYGFPSRGGVQRSRPRVSRAKFLPMRSTDRSSRRILEGVSGHCIKTMPASIRSTPDFHFIIDRHPAMDRVIVAITLLGPWFQALGGDRGGTRAVGGGRAIGARPCAFSSLALRYCWRLTYLPTPQAALLTM
jgi:sarcosine oxidase